MRDDPFAPVRIDPEATERAFGHLVLAIEQIGARARISDYEIKVARGDSEQWLVFNLVRQIAAYRGNQTVEVPEITVPATWWDAFKARYYSDWLLARFPVRFRILQQHHVYRADLMLPAVELPDNKKAGAFAVFTETR